MAVTITGRFIGNKRVTLTHEASGAQMTTVAPIDNGGDGSLFSPTDLVGAGLGACMLTIIANVAERKGISVDGMHMRVEKHMQTEPRRIGKLPVEIHLPAGLTPEQRTLFERAALTCPVHHSLHPDIESEVRFVYDA